VKDFDAIIVGAGLGGLSAATALSQAGKKVLLMERHNVPGGYASSFLRGRFEFDASLHELSGVGAGPAKGPLWMLLKQYGVADKVEFVPIPDLYRCVLPEVDMTIPVGRAEFEEVLCGRFPSQAQGIRDFTATAFDFALEAIQANMLGRGPDNLDLSSLPKLRANMGRTMAEVCFPLIEDPQARAVVSQLCQYLGQPPSKVGFLPFAMALFSYLSFGPVHIRGTSQALSQAFVEVIEENGGEVWLNNGASRLLVADGRVRGVVAEDGAEVFCTHVICNANPLVTCFKLIGRDNVPPWYLKRLTAWSPGLSTFSVFLGLDRECGDLGLSTHETFVGTDYDLDRLYDAASQDLDADVPGAGVTAYNAADPDFSPPGTSVVVITLGAFPEPWLRLDPSQYNDAKSRVADKALGMAETVAPGLRGHIEVMEAATPLTNIRYAHNPGGSYSGFAESRFPADLPQLPSRGPLEGLYFANAWVRIGGGYMPCIFSGHLAAKDVLEDMDDKGHAGSTITAMAAAMERQLEGRTETDEPGDLLGEKILTPLHPGRLKMKVAQVIEETPSAKTLRLAPESDLPPLFEAGQYINLFVNVEGVETSRPYTISSAPGQPHLDITVRRKQGGFVSPYLLDQVGPGDFLESSGPAGTFVHQPLTDTGELVFLAGGSGVTPFISMMRAAAERRSSLKMHLIYGSRVPDDIIFERQLNSLVKENPNLQVDFIISEPPPDWAGRRGLLDKDNIGSLVETVAGKTFFFCGPPLMHALCEVALKDLGVPGRRIKREAYGPPEDVTRQPDWPGISAGAQFEVIEERSGKRFKASAGEPLMNSLERAGLVVPALCRSGECAACRTRLISGEIYVPRHVHRRWSDEKAGYIHPCMSYPIQDLRIRL
jgi:prolycopene isomerase